MNYLSSIQMTLSKFKDFKGVATREEFWYYFIFFVLGVVISSAIDIFVGSWYSDFYINVGLFSGIFILLTLIPYIAVAIRRLRDAGYCPYLFLLTLLPFVGNIILFVLWCMPTKNLDNQIE